MRRLLLIFCYEKNDEKCHGVIVGKGGGGKRGKEKKRKEKKKKRKRIIA